MLDEYQETDTDDTREDLGTVCIIHTAQTLILSDRSFRYQLVLLMTLHLSPKYTNVGTEVDIPKHNQMLSSVDRKQTKQSQSPRAVIQNSVSLALSCFVRIVIRISANVDPGPPDLGEGGLRQRCRCLRERIVVPQRTCTEERRGIW